jgi:N-acetyl sugar amidotransferase
MEHISDPKLLKRCSKCVMPETQEIITFDENGVCSTCRNVAIKQEKIDWTKKKEEFLNILDQYRGKYLYDCIVPFSGGKDSAYTVYSLVKDYGLKPLVVSFNHHMLRPTVLANRDKTIKRMGVDILDFKADWQLIKRMMRITLERKGNILWYEETGIFSLPMHAAIKFNVPLVIWGEPSAEYTSYYSYDEAEEVDETRFNMFVNVGITAQDMLGMLNEKAKTSGEPTVTPEKLWPYTYPKREDLRSIGCRSICLGSFQPWDVKKQVDIIQKELDWKGDEVEGVPPEYNYEKIEDMMQGVQDYLKFIKRGYGRMSHLASIDVRNGRLTREDGMRLVEQWEGLRPASLDVFLRWMNMSEDEFYQTVSGMCIAPWKHDPENTKHGKELWDQNVWNKD